jgi:hypothetical protein
MKSHQWMEHFYNGRAFEIAYRFFSCPNGALRERDQAVEELSDRTSVLRDRMFGRRPPRRQCKSSAVRVGETPAKHWNTKLGRVSEVRDCYSEHVGDLTEASFDQMVGRAGSAIRRGRHVNVGTGGDRSIRSLAELVRDIVYPAAELAFDPSKPNGRAPEVLDVSKLRSLGWSPTIGLEDGIRSTYQWFLGAVQADEVRGREQLPPVT